MKGHRTGRFQFQRELTLVQRVRRWVRLNFFVAMGAAVVYIVGVLVALDQDPERFPTRFGTRASGLLHGLRPRFGGHGYVVGRVLFLGTGMLVQAILLLRGRVLESRAVAGLMGAFLLLFTLLPDAVLATIDMSAPPGNGWLLYIGVSCAAFAILGE